MITIELTQIQANRWNRHLADGRNAAGGTRSPTTPERKKAAIALYQKCESISHVARELRMGRDTLKSILKSNGVPI